MCIRITVPTVEKELNTASTPVLLACLHPDAEIRSQVEVLEQVSVQFGERLKVCLLCEAFTGVFGHSYGIEGTPTYLIVDQNKEVDRLLGRVDLSTLKRFIEQTILNS